MLSVAPCDFFLALYPGKSRSLATLLVAAWPGYETRERHETHDGKTTIEEQSSGVIGACFEHRTLTEARRQSPDALYGLLDTAMVGTDGLSLGQVLLGRRRTQ